MMTLEPLCAQDRTVAFGTSDSGESKAIPTWGLDTAWLSSDNVRRGVIFMGQPQVDVIRFSFTGDTTVSGGNLTGTGLTEFNLRMSIVNAYTDSHTKLYLNNDTDTLNAYYQGVNGVNAATWAQLIDVTRSNCVAAGRAVLSVSPFNEPDYGTWQGTSTRLGEVCAQLRTTYSAGFSGVRVYGASTLNDDQANPWYNAVKGLGYLEEGCTHQLAGSFINYAAFFQNVQANGDLGANDELHNVMEAMVGAEYGMDVGIWWGTAERARGEFVKASDGQRLGYAEHRGNWTAASVYRGTNGAVQAFVGESERQALPTTYRLFSTDRDVFYDGDGPRRDYTVTTTGGPGYQTTAHRNAERVVNITWGDDVQPAIDGRYVLVNRKSHWVMEVSTPAGSANGENIRQYAFTGALNQQWDVIPLAWTNGGDYSYFAITAAHSGKAADVNNFSYNDGANVQQWDNAGSPNQQWFLEYVSDGYFYIRSRWSGKYLEVANGSVSLGANIQQGSGGGFHQQWRLIPAGNAVEFAAPPQVTGVIATANTRSIHVTWNTSPATDLAGYTVLRSTNSGGPYDTVARGLTNNAFTDKAANRPQPYYYVVQAADKSLNRSINSLEVEASPTGGPALVACYRFDGNTTDSSGNANHPILTSGTPSFPGGLYGSALDLNGANQYTMLPANLLAGVSNFTIAVWVNWDGGNMWQRIFDFGNGPTENMFLTPYSGGNTLRFAITTSGGGGEQQLNASTLPVGQWRHVTVTRNGTTAKLYVNGVVVDTKTITIAPASINPALNYLGDSQYEADSLFNGRLDEMFIYDYALSDTEIVNLMNNQPPPPTTPTTISAVHAANTLNLSWPPNYIGCRLQAQTNTLATGLGNSWHDVAGSAGTNVVDLPVDPANGSVFYRLVYP